jgi:hypothetical protein
MAFRNSAINTFVANTYTALYTAPASYEAVVHSIFLANTDPVNSITVDIQIVSHNNGTPFNSSSTATVTAVIATNIMIPAGTTFEIDKSINLRATDILNIRSSATTVTAYASILLTAADSVAP